jgi:hypothetical protein
MLSFKKWYPTYSCYKVWDDSRREYMRVHMQEAYEVALLNNKKARPTVRAKRTVQQRKGETVLDCRDCVGRAMCLKARVGYICGAFKQRTASPVA